MKRATLFILFISFIIVLVSCSDLPDSTSDDWSINSIDISETSVNESNKEESSVKTPTSFLLAETENSSAFGKTKSVFSYDSYGRPVLTVNYTNGVEYRREAFTYDENGFLIEKETVTLSTDGKVSSTWTESYTNTDSGQPIKGTIKIVTGTTETISSFSYYYDDRNRVVKYEQHDQNGVTESLKEYEHLDENGSYRLTTDGKSINEYWYDDVGNEIRVLSGDTEGKTYSDISYEYDDNNFITKQTNAKGTVIEYVYVINKKGKADSAELRSDGEIISGISYFYDEYGNMLKKTEKNAAGTEVSVIVNTWTPVYE